MIRGNKYSHQITETQKIGTYRKEDKRMGRENMWCYHSLKPQDVPWELESQRGPPVESQDIRSREVVSEQEQKSWMIPRNYKDIVLRRPALVSVHLPPTNISSIQHRSQCAGSMGNVAPYVTECVYVRVDGYERKLSVSLAQMTTFQVSRDKANLPCTYFLTYFWPL